jgi:hypothetical protein
MNPATNKTITAPTIRYVLLEPPDPLLRLLPLLFAKIHLFLACGEIVAHATRFSERLQNARATSPTANAARGDPNGVTTTKAAAKARAYQGTLGSL